MTIAASRTLDIFVVGSGMVGRATGLSLMSKGHQATFYDVDGSKLKLLEKAGNVTTKDISGVKRADAVAVCVPTPARDHSLETAFVRSALSSAAPVSYTTNPSVMASALGFNKHME